ncbi:MAG: hypothetical protein R2794_02730 [Chitinophagales bacterium]
MKNAILTAAFLLCVTAVFAQTDTTWKKGGGAILNFNQTSLTNWAAGGESTLDNRTDEFFTLTIKKKKTTLDNT